MRGIVMAGFQIDAERLEWINGDADDPRDLCLHGEATAVIGEECFTYYCTVSSTALYLLKSLTQDHLIGEDYRREVVRFADKIEAYYESCSPKIIGEDEYDRVAYTAFWNEWHRRRSFVPCGIRCGAITYEWSRVNF